MVVIETPDASSLSFPPTHDAEGELWHPEIWCGTALYDDIWELDVELEMNLDLEGQE